MKTVVRPFFPILLLVSTLVGACDPAAASGEGADDPGCAGKCDDAEPTDVEFWEPVAGFDFAGGCGTIRVGVEDDLELGPPPGVREHEDSPWVCDEAGCTLQLPRVSIDRGDGPESFCLRLTEVTLVDLGIETYILGEPTIDPPGPFNEMHFLTGGDRTGRTGALLCQALGMQGGEYWADGEGADPYVQLRADGEHVEMSFWDVSELTDHPFGYTELACRRYVADSDVHGW